MAVKKTIRKEKDLKRIEEGKVIAGVCTGLGEYFDIDPTIIRIIFIIISLFGGSGIIIYPILWLIIPGEKSNGKLNEDSIKNNAKEMKEKAKEFGESAKDFAGSRNSRYFLGISLLLIGIFLTLGNFGFFHYINFSKLWPLILIVLALAILKDNKNNG